MTTRLDLARGMEAAASAVEALADGGEQAALDLLNDLSHGEAVTCAVTLLADLREAVAMLVDGDQARVRRALRASAAAIRGEDLPTTGFLTAIHDFERKVGNV